MRLTAADSLERFVVNAMPDQLIHAAAPNHRRHPAVTQSHQKTVNRLGRSLADGDLRFQPIALRLRSCRCFHSAKRPQLRRQNFERTYLRIDLYDPE